MVYLNASFVLLIGLQVATISAAAAAACPNCEVIQFNGVNDEKALSQLQEFLSGHLENCGAISIDTEMRVKTETTTIKHHNTEPPAMEKTTTNTGSVWKKSGNKYFKCFNDGKATYAEAKTNCSSFKRGRLAAEVLRDPVAASYIASECVSLYYDERNPWIGFDDIANEGDWRWSDGGVLNNITVEWDIKEPNNGDGKGEENCAQIWDVSHENKLKINDQNCHRRFNFICEV